MNQTDQKPENRPADPTVSQADPRPRYQPPRLIKKKSVSRMTLSFGGATGIPAAGIPGVP